MAKKSTKGVKAKKATPKKAPAKTTNAKKGTGKKQNDDEGKDGTIDGLCEAIKHAQKNETAAIGLAVGEDGMYIGLIGPEVSLVALMAASMRQNQRFQKIMHHAFMYCLTH